MSRRPVPLFCAALLIVLCVSVTACSSDASSSCDEMRAELARATTPITVDSWDDIAVLDDSTTEALRLRDELALRCD